jgi:hypothetical protein
VKSKTSFRLPPDVWFEKQRLSNAWAYVFRHRQLGEIGRILLQELGDGRCHISCEVVGDPSDPMTTQREAIFKPLGLELTRQMETVMGRILEKVGPVDIPPRPPETKEIIESKLIACERCGAVVAMLIFAPNATDPGHFEDYARKMYPHYNHLNVPTWIIGPALGEAPLIGRPADVLKVWPAREADSTVITCAIQFAPGSVCYEALSLTLPPTGARVQAPRYNRKLWMRS